MHNLRLTLGYLKRPRLYPELWRIARARLAGASARGADLTGVELAGAIDVRTVSCDDATVPPSGWRCSAGLLEPGEGGEP